MKGHYVGVIRDQRYHKCVRLSDLHKTEILIKAFVITVGQFLSLGHNLIFLGFRLRLRVRYFSKCYCFCSSIWGIPLKRNELELEDFLQVIYTVTLIKSIALAFTRCNCLGFLFVKNFENLRFVVSASTSLFRSISCLFKNMSTYKL